VLADLVDALVTDLAAAGVALRLDGDLLVANPRVHLTLDLTERIRAHRNALMARVRTTASLPTWDELLAGADLGLAGSDRLAAAAIATHVTDEWDEADRVALAGDLRDELVALAGPALPRAWAVYADAYREARYRLARRR